MAITEATAAAISAGVQAAAAGGSMAVSGKMNRKAVRESRRNREWQTREREAQQAYQTEMWERTNQWNLEQWNRANEWNLAQWNRENEYNSAASQIQRLQEAGLSPMAYLQGANAGMANGLDTQPVQASPVSGGSAPGGSLPQMFNPAQTLQSAMEIAQKGFFEYLAAKRDDQRVQNETLGTTTHAEYEASLAATENALRKGKVELNGVTIALSKAKINETEENIKALAQSITKSQKECQQIDEYCQNLRVDRDYVSWKKYCEQRKLPYEVQLLGAQVMHLKSQKAESWRRQRLLDEELKEKRHYNQNYMKDNQRNDWYIKYYQAKQAEGGTYSNFGYTWLRGINITNQTINTLTNSIRGYSLGRNALQIRQQAMKQSTENPNPFGSFSAPEPNGASFRYNTPSGW